VLHPAWVVPCQGLYLLLPQHLARLLEVVEEDLPAVAAGVVAVVVGSCLWALVRHKVVRKAR